MYAREHSQNTTGAVRAFEDAYAKEEFLRRSAEMSENRPRTPQRESPPIRKAAEQTVRSPGAQEPGATSLPREREITETPELAAGASAHGIYVAEPSAYPKKEEKRGGLRELLGGNNSGDLLLILLIVFFLTDSDKENDTLIPILLGVLLLF